MAYSIFLGYGLDGWGFEFRERQEIYFFSETSRLSLESLSLLFNCNGVLLERGKAARA